MADQALTTFLKERERLILIAVRMVKSRAVAEELVQDSWLRWAAKDYPAEKALPIFSRIVTNLALNWSKSYRIEQRFLSELLHSHETDVDSERILIAREELARVVEVLENLPPRSMAAFYMRFIDGMTFTEIGKRLELSRSRAQAVVKTVLINLTYVITD